MSILIEPMTSKSLCESVTPLGATGVDITRRVLTVSLSGSARYGGCPTQRLDKLNPHVIANLEYKKEDSRITLVNPNLVAHIDPGRDHIRPTQLHLPAVDPL
jgi:hypothetical protein